jgi:hypothetical protein
LRHLDGTDRHRRPHLRARAVTEAKRDVRVSAAVLGPEDCVRMLGTDVTAAGVQPVWIEVRNDTENVLWLLRSGADPDYFSPLEVAWSSHVPGKRNQRAYRRALQPAGVSQSDSAHGVSSGILFTNPQPVTKLLTVDLLGSQMMIPFTLFLPVPAISSAPKSWFIDTRQRTSPTTTISMRCAMRSASALLRGDG